MGKIEVVNKSPGDIYVNVTIDGDEGSADWYPLKPGESDSWARNRYQVVRFTRNLAVGVSVESVLGIPGAIVDIR